MTERRRAPSPIALALAAAIREIAARRATERQEGRRKLTVVETEQRREERVA